MKNYKDIQRESKNILFEGIALLAAIIGLVTLSILSRRFGFFAAACTFLIFFVLYKWPRMYWAMRVQKTLHLQTKNVAELNLKLRKLAERKSERLQMIRRSRRYRKLEERAERTGIHGASQVVRNLIDEGLDTKAVTLIESLEANTFLLKEAQDLHVLDQTLSALYNQGCTEALKIVEAARQERMTIELAANLGVMAEAQDLFTRGEKAAAVKLVAEKERLQKNQARITLISKRAESLSPELRSAVTPLIEQAQNAVEQNDRVFRKALYEAEQKLSHLLTS